VETATLATRMSDAYGQITWMHMPLSDIAELQHLDDFPGDNEQAKL